MISLAGLLIWAAIVYTLPSIVYLPTWGEVNQNSYNKYMSTLVVRGGMALH